MKRVIYTPAVGELIPDGAIYYVLPVAGAVVDVLADVVTTTGSVRYDSDTGVPMAEPHTHHFEGWEV